MSNPIAELDDDVIKQLLNVGSTFAAINVAVDVLEKASFDDDDVEAIGWLPIGLRAYTTARILDAVVGLREELREIDGRLLLLTGAPEPAGSTEP